MNRNPKAMAEAICSKVPINSAPVNSKKCVQWQRLKVQLIWLTLDFISVKI